MPTGVHRTHKIIVLSFTLLSAAAGFSRNFNLLKKSANPATESYLSVTAPADVIVNTDALNNVATGVSLGSPVISDDAVSINNNAPAVFPIGKTIVIWTANDGYGNTATASQTVTVLDIEKPNISRLGGISVVNAAGFCNAVVKLRIPFATDNSGQVTVTHNGPEVFPVGSTMLTWTASDASGNYDTIMQKVTVIDNELPQISIHQATIEVTVDAGFCGATVALALPTVWDNCGIASLTNNAPAVFPVGVTIVKWTVIDLAGYKAGATQTIIVTDNQAPSITAPPNIVATSGTVVTGNPTVTDNCGISSITNNAPSLFPMGTTEVVWTATDIHGNISTAKQIITVQDKTAPVIVAPNIVAGNDVNKCGAIVHYSVTITDNSEGPVTVSYNKASGSFFSSGNTTVTVTASDASGNSKSGNFIVTVNDTQKPTVTAPSNVSVSTSNSTGTANIKLGRASASDNCGVQSLGNNAPFYYPIGTTQVIWTVKDKAGNINTAVQTVTVTYNRRRNNATGNEQSIKLEDGEDTGLSVKTGYNPSSSYFTLYVQSPFLTPVNIRVADAMGRMVEAKSGVAANGTVQIGHSYNRGTYVVEIMQGKTRKTVQLIKIQ